MEVKIEVPDGISGEWSVSSFIVSEQDAKRDALYGSLHSGRCVPAGSYKQLKRNNQIVMSNTPDEIRDCSYFIHKATGDVLINGLGLGVVLKMLLDKPEIKSVTIIEKSLDVIKLVAPTYEKDLRVKIINADAFEYNPEKGKKFDVVWHDIWDDICSDNLIEMKKLHRKYGKRTKYQESWCRYYCERQNRTGF